MKDSNFMKKDI